MGALAGTGSDSLADVVGAGGGSAGSGESVLAEPATVRTFLFTDIEGSTRSWQAAPESMASALAVHDKILSDSVEANGGAVVKHTGDGVLAVFDGPRAGVRAAVDAQLSLLDAVPFAVRMGVAAGEAQARDGDWFGPAVNRAARLLDAGNGGQILVSAAAAALIHDLPVPGVGIRPLGEFRLRGLPDPEAIHQADAPGLPSQHPPLRTAAAPVHTLPAPRTPIVGRGAELAELASQLHQARVLTLTGVGGVGKTRLALELATRSLEGYEGGVFFVELASVTDGPAVAGAVAAAVGIDGGVFVASQRPVDQLVAYLASRRALVVLDNCEHLLDDAADLVDHLVDCCPQLTVLVTSREPLGVEGERVWRAPSLGTEGDDAGAVALFLERGAAAAGPGSVAPGSGELEVVAEICRRLDGIPLAIELAAAQTAHLSTEEILARLHDRFSLLTGGRRRVQRQQTLQAAVQWSHDLLDDEERRLLRWLSVFAGWFEAASVEAVCGAGADTVRRLGALVAKSLVVTDERRTRYRLLETIRLYAEEQLVAAGEADAARRAHARWIVDFILGLPMEVSSSLDFVDSLAHLADDVRAALGWLVDQGEHVTAAHVANATTSFWWLYGRAAEVLAVVDRVDLDALSPADRAAHLGFCAGLALTAGDLARVGEMTAAARQLEADQENSGVLQAQLYSALLQIRDDPRGARQALTSARRQAEELGRTTLARLARDHLALATMAEDPAAALAEWEDLVRTADHQHRRVEDYHAMCSLAVASHIAGNHARTREMADELQRRGFCIGKWTISYTAVLYRALAAVGEHELERAAELLRDLLRNHTNAFSLRDKELGLVAAALLHGRGEHADAAHLLGALRGREPLFAFRIPISHALHLHLRALVHGVLGDAAARERYQQGRAGDVLALTAAAVAEA